MKKGARRISAFFLSLVLIVIILQSGLTVSEASSGSISAASQTESGIVTSESSLSTPANTQGTSVQTEQSGTDSILTEPVSSAVLSDSTDAASLNLASSSGADSTGTSSTEPTSESSTDSAVESSTDAATAAVSGTNAGDISTDSAAGAQNTESVDSSSVGVAGSQSYTKQNDYTVTVTYGEDAGFPEGVKLQAEEITGASAVENYTQQAESALNGETISAARFFDISFVKDGQEVEPQADVTVEISLAGSLEVSDGAKVQAVHYDEASGAVSPEVLEVNTTKNAEGNVEKVQFTQSSFSVTGVVVSDGALSTDGEEHVVILQGSDNDYYALNHDGTLTKVSVSTENGTTNITFSDFTSADQVSDYKWMTTASSSSSGTIYYDDADSQRHYLYPDSTGVVHDTEGTVTIDSEGRLTDSTGAYYLSVNCEQAVGLSSSSSYYSPSGPWLYGQSPADNAAKLVTADDFAVDSTGTDPGTGGDTSSENLDAPEAAKSLTDNENGTYDLTLSVKGEAAANTTISSADVVVVFDESTSMRTSLSDSGTRLDAAKEALNTLTDTLLGDSNSNGQVRMKLIRFDTTADNGSNWYTDATSFKELYANDQPVSYNPYSNEGGHKLGGCASGGR